MTANHSQSGEIVVKVVNEQNLTRLQIANIIAAHAALGLNRCLIHTNNYVDYNVRSVESILEKSIGYENRTLRA